MTVKELTLDSLLALDGGRVATAFQHALRRALDDCRDRPGEERARVVSLQLEMVPVCDESGLCDEVTAGFQVNDKIPTRKSKKYSMGIRSGADGPMAVFNADSLDNVNQGTLLPDE
jgi:hypothetical protein